ncbi:hypothetical protein E1285_14045 [Actinomadura sp. 7K507]|nr:hypothetical protein E1285_14045 [Actinomadura sp. 7K507]
MLVAFCLTLAVGCGGGEPEPRAGASQSASQPTTEPATESPVIGDLYLDRGDCVREEKKDTETAYPEVACDDRRAVAKVLSRYLDDTVTDLRGSDCMDDTDLLVDMRASLGLLGAAARADEGYACLRNLKEPHPSDPGRGGGPGLRVGDCVKVTESELGSGLIRRSMGAELPCKGSKRGSTYRIVKISTEKRYAGGDCPDAAEEFRPTSLSGESDVLEEVEFYCAVER